MTKPVIINRVAKGAALTYEEQDANFANLQNATLTVTDGTNSKALNLNDTLAFTAGTNITLAVDPTTGAVTINSTSVSTPAGANTQIQYNNSGAFGASSGLTYDGVSLKVNGNLESVYSNGDEGGEIYLNKPTTNTTLAAGVTIDVYQNKLRFFENGGGNRGAYIDLSLTGLGVGTDLLTSGSSQFFGSINNVVYVVSTSGGTITLSSAPLTNNFVTNNVAAGNSYHLNFNFTPDRPMHWRFFVNSVNGASFIPQFLGTNMYLGNTGVGNTAGKHIYDIYYVGTDYGTLPTWGGYSTSSWIYFVTTN